MLIINTDTLSRFRLYEINAEDINAAYISYNAIDNLELGIKFYIKQFHYNSHKNNLLQFYPILKPPQVQSSIGLPELCFF